VYTNLLISSITGVITFGWTTFLDSDQSLFYSVVVFGATLFTYNLHRILRLKEIQHTYSHRHIWLIQHPVILYALAGIGLALTGVFYILYFFSLYSFLILGLVGLISVSYAWRIKAGRKTLRELPYLKIYLIALSWMLVCFVWPIISEQKHIIDYWMVIVASYLYVFAATIPFDIRDYTFDARDQKTIPHIIGEKNAKLVAVASLVTSYSLLTYFSSDVVTNLLFMMAYLGMFLLIVFTRQKNYELYFSFLIDAWILFFGLGFLTL